jgi:hypothetical protein
VPRDRRASRDPGSTPDRVLDQRGDVLDGFGTDERADLVVRVGSGTDSQRLDLFSEPRHEFVRDVGVHVEPVGSGAGLTAAAELRDHRPVDSGIEVGIGGDDERCVAAQLHGGVDHALRGLAQ